MQVKENEKQQSTNEINIKFDSNYKLSIKSFYNKEVKTTLENIPNDSIFKLSSDQNKDGNLGNISVSQKKQDNEWCSFLEIATIEDEEKIELHRNKNYNESCSFYSELKNIIYREKKGHRSYLKMKMDFLHQL